MRRNARNALVVAASAVAALGPLAGLANAEATAPQPTAAYAGGAVVSNGTTATVRVVYTCTTQVSPANHLFVAVKQGPGVSPQNPSSSPSMTAFLSTNWHSDQGSNALVCDGKRHLQKIELQQQPGFTGGPLTTGPALVQICVYDNITGASGNGEPVGGFAPSYTMQKVVVTHAPSK
jgi:hypothetical protein